MNLRQLVDLDKVQRIRIKTSIFREVYGHAIIDAGGPGSGCHGPNCGRPAGHTGPHRPEGAKTWIEQKQDEKLKQQEFKEERKRLGLLKYGLRRKQLSVIQQQQAKEAGQLRRKDVKELKKGGQVIDMKSPGLKMKFEPGKVIETKTVPIEINGRVHAIEVEVMKRVGAEATPKMGKVRGTNVPEGPPNKAHSLHGQFVESMRLNVPEENRRFVAFDATTSIHDTLHGPIPGAGASVFVNKETVGNKSSTLIQEVKRGDDARIDETRKYTFKSGKAAKEFLNQRYGIRKFNWTKP